MTQEFDPSSGINTGEIVSLNEILQVTLKPSTIRKYKTYQTIWDNYCMQNNVSHIQPKISVFFAIVYLTSIEIIFTIYNFICIV